MNLLFNSHPLVIDKDLANILGLNEALVLQQIHYWLKINRQADKNRFAGRWWTYNTVAEWQEQFSFFSASTVKRTLKALRDKGLLITANYNRKRMDRTLWYTIDYDLLEILEQKYYAQAAKQQQPHQKPAKTAQDEAEFVENGVDTQQANLTQCKGSDWSNALGQNDPMQKVNLTQAIPEINTETTTEIPSIYQEDEKQEKEHSMDEIDYAETQELVRGCIEAEFLETQYGKEQIDEIVLLLTDTLCCTAPRVRIGRQLVHRGVVRGRLMKLNETHVARVLNTMRENPVRIYNIRAYLLTALYNAPATSANQIAAQVYYSLRRPVPGES